MYAVDSVRMDLPDALVGAMSEFTVKWACHFGDSRSSYDWDLPSDHDMGVYDNIVINDMFRPLSDAIADVIREVYPIERLSDMRKHTNSQWAQFYMTVSALAPYMTVRQRVQTLFPTEAVFQGALKMKQYRKYSVVSNSFSLRVGA